MFYDDVFVFGIVCKAGGKPSTWLPPGGLVERKGSGEIPPTTAREATVFSAKLRGGATAPGVAERTDP